MRAASPRRPVRGTPDDVAELRAVAEALADPPRDAHPFDIINLAARSARRIRAVADRLQVEPTPGPQRPALPPRETREREERRRRARAILRRPAGQAVLPL